MRQHNVTQSSQNSAFTTVPSRRFGYKTSEVDDFMTRARAAYEGNELMSADEVRDVSFTAVKGGYAAHQVDQVLDRLEDAFRQAERDEEIEAIGADAWREGLNESIREIVARLKRPNGEKFRPGKRKNLSYATEDVDRFCARLYDFFKNNNGLEVTELRNLTFRAVKDKKGYDEAQVDAFIQRVIEILVVID